MIQCEPNGNRAGSQNVSRGRPKGSTDEKKLKGTEDDKTVTYQLAVLLKEAMDAAKKDRGIGARVSKKAWEDICERVARDYDVSFEDVLSKKDTVYSRLRRGNMTGVRLQSPIEEIEPILVEMAMMRARMNQPLNREEVIQFATSLLSGSPVHEKLKKYHAKCGRSKDKIGELGYGWYGSFLRRHETLLASTKPVPFPNRRSQWATYENFELMYDKTYEIWEECGIAEKLQRPLHLDRNGFEFVPDETNRHLICPYRLLYPQAALAADEVGNNTGTTKDKLVGNEKRLHSRQDGRRALKVSSESDIAWTLLAITALTGECVCCVVIIEGSCFTAKDVSGEDITAALDLQAWDFGDQSNHGKGNRFPGGPVCHFRGKTIPCLVASSRSGGITSEILTNILRHLDKHGVYDRDNDPFTPTIQLDCHHTRFQMDFLNYCVEPETKWVVTMGCPEATHLWQIQDASELNGQHKTAMYKYKSNLIAFKRRLGLSLNIKRTDIIPLVNHAWDHSFAGVDTKRNAIAERGWNPMNRALLHHPSIQKTNPQATQPLPDTNNLEQARVRTDEEEDRTTLEINERTISIQACQTTVNVPVSTVNSLNLTSGLAGEYMTDLLMFARSKERMKENIKKRVSEQASFAEKTKDAKQRTSPGQLFKDGILGITSDESYAIWKGKLDQKIATQKATVVKAMEEYAKLTSSVKHIIKNVKTSMIRSDEYSFNDPQATLPLSHIPVALLSITQLKTLMRFQYRKAKGDKGFAKLSLDAARRVWTEICVRPPYGMKDYLIHEKKYEEKVVSDVLRRPRPADPPNQNTRNNQILPRAPVFIMPPAPTVAVHTTAEATGLMPDALATPVLMAPAALRTGPLMRPEPTVLTPAADATETENSRTETLEEKEALMGLMQISATGTVEGEAEL